MKSALALLLLSFGCTTVPHSIALSFVTSHRDESLVFANGCGFDPAQREFWAERIVVIIESDPPVRAMLTAEQADRVRESVLRAYSRRLLRAAQGDSRLEHDAAMFASTLGTWRVTFTEDFRAVFFRDGYVLDEDGSMWKHSVLANHRLDSSEPVLVDFASGRDSAFFDLTYGKRDAHPPIRISSAWLKCEVVSGVPLGPSARLKADVMPQAEAEHLLQDLYEFLENI